MKKFKTLALCLCAFVLSLCMFTGCGPQMAELKDVNFDNAETVSAEQLSTEFTNENFAPYHYMEISMNATLPATDGSTETITYALNGRLGVNIDDNTEITDPSQVLGLINGEFELKSTFNNQEISGKIYIYEQFVYMERGDEKSKMSFKDFINNFLPTSSDTSVDISTSFDPEILVAVMSYLNAPQKIVDGNYTYYRITFTSNEGEDIDVINQLEIVIGLEGQKLTKVYVKFGDMMDLSIKFVQSTQISAPTSPESYVAM